MRTYTISDADGNGYTRMYSGGDIEYVDPVKYYLETMSNIYASEIKDLLFLKDADQASQISGDWFLKKGKEQWLEEYEEIKKAQIADSFMMLLQSKSKKDQIKLLRNQNLTPEQLMAFITIAWTDYGYYYSKYSAEHLHKGLENEVLPKFLHVEGETITKVGETTLSDGQLKNLVEHRKVTVSNFLDNGPNWHCFYITFNSIRGKEKAWKNGQAHYHYFSDKFGIPRNELVERLKSENLPTSPVHIDLLDYGNQTVG